MHAYFIEYSLGDKNDPDSYDFVYYNYYNNYTDYEDEIDDEYIDMYVKASGSRLNIITGEEEPFTAISSNYAYTELLDDLLEAKNDDFYPSMIFEMSKLYDSDLYDSDFSDVAYIFSGKYFYVYNSQYERVFPIENKELKYNKFVCVIYDVDGNVITDISSKVAGGDPIKLAENKYLINADSSATAAIVDANLENPTYIGVSIESVNLDDKVLFGYYYDMDNDISYYGVLDFDGKIVVPFKYADFHYRVINDIFVMYDFSDNICLVDRRGNVNNIDELENLAGSNITGSGYYTTKTIKYFEEGNDNSVYYEINVYLPGITAPIFTVKTTNATTDVRINAEESYDRLYVLIGAYTMPDLAWAEGAYVGNSSEYTQLLYSITDSPYVVSVGRYVD